MDQRSEGISGWAGVTCLVTGGLGFVGGNLALALAHGGARVRVIDALVPGHGGRADQLDGANVDTIEVASIDDPVVGDLLDGVDVVFNVAGQVSHQASMRDPLGDLSWNATAQVGLLDAVRRVAPAARVVYTSTRQVYGKVGGDTPVNESVMPRPADVNGVAKLAAEQLHVVYAGAHGLAVTALRLTNVYGPRQRLTSNELGFLPVFVRRALDGEPIEIYGDGSQRRDCLHVDDVVAALLAAAVAAPPEGHVVNIGHPDAHRLVDIARVILRAAGRDDEPQLVAWPASAARIDIGSFRTDSSLAATALGWQATIDLAVGMADTIGYFRGHPDRVAADPIATVAP